MPSVLVNPSFTDLPIAIPCAEDWQEVVGTSLSNGEFQLPDPGLSIDRAAPDDFVSGAPDGWSVNLTAPGRLDRDVDGDMDLADFVRFVNCAGGPGVPSDPACSSS